MLRFIFKQQIANAQSNMHHETLHTLVANIPLVEALLCHGGYGPDGYDLTTLVGVEVCEDAPVVGQLNSVVSLQTRRNRTGARR
jgi:hypothetical protein